MNSQTDQTTNARHLSPGFAHAGLGLRRKFSGLLAGFGFAAAFLASAPALAQNVGAAQSYAILGGTAVTVGGAGATINGDLGIEPAALAAITGGPAVTPPFAIYSPPASNPARAATTTLSIDPLMAPAGGVAIAANMSTGGPTANGHYTPGKYSLAVGVAIIPTSITLDGPGIYVFSLNSALTTSVGSTVVLNGADPCSVFWLVPTLATLDGVNFPGTVVAGAGVHMGVGATLTGRALVAAAGDVTLAGGNTVGGCSAAGGPVGLAATSLSTAASASVAIGGAISDTATLSGGGLGGAAPTGTITFNLYAPSDATCAAAPVFTSVVPVSGNGIYNSASFASAAIGTYRWIANYSGDANNNPFTGVCGAAGESVIVTAALLPPATGVPTLSEWAMIMLTALLAISGFAAMRRRSR